MELSLYFAGLVALVCMVHLATVATEVVGNFLAKNSSEKSTSPVNAPVRDDWYLFFHCKDLYGTPSKCTPAPAVANKKETMTREQRKRKPARIHSRM